MEVETLQYGAEPLLDEIVALLLSGNDINTSFRLLFSLVEHWARLPDPEKIRSYLKQTLLMKSQTRPTEHWYRGAYRNYAVSVDHWSASDVRERLLRELVDDIIYENYVRGGELPELGIEYLKSAITTASPNIGEIAQGLAVLEVAQAMSCLVRATLIWAYIEDPEVIRRSARRIERYREDWGRKEFFQHILYSLELSVH